MKCMIEALFIDRDGAIGGDSSVTYPDEFELYPFTREALNLAKQHHIRLFAFSNQPGISIGECSNGALRELHEEVGIKAKADELLYIGDTYHSDYIVDTYLYNQYIEIEDLVLQLEEVVNAKYVSFVEMQDMYNKNEIVESVWERFSHFKDRLI